MVLMVKLWDLFGPSDTLGQPTGPIELQFNSVLAKEALQRDPARFVVELPKNINPGRADKERKKQEADRQAEFDAELPDPHYGRPKK